MKKCPFCAEEIQEDAIFCKHCRNSLDQSIGQPKENLLNIAKYTSAGWKPIRHTQKEAVLRMPKKIDWIWVAVLTFLSIVTAGFPIVAYIMYYVMLKKPPIIWLELAEDGNINIMGNIDIAEKSLKAQAAEDALTPEERRAASRKKTIILLVVFVGVPLICTTLTVIAAIISNGL